LVTIAQSVHQSDGYAEYIRRTLGWQAERVGRTLLFRMAPGVYTSTYLTEVPEGYEHKMMFATTHPLSGLPGNTNESTFIIDLSRGRDAVWEGMEKDSGRKLVKRAAERGVDVREATSSRDIEAYWKMLNAFRSYKGFQPTPIGYTTQLLACLPGVAKLFVAEKDGRMLAGQIITAYGGYVVEWGLCRDPLLREPLYPQELLKWRILEWCMDTGQRWYDFSGTGATEGIKKWKAKFGGREVKFHGIHHPTLARRVMLKAYKALRW